MKKYLLLALSLMCLQAFAQNSNIQGQLQDPNGEAIVYANVALFSQKDSTLAKIETSSETGIFKFNEIIPGDYYLTATYVGYPKLMLVIKALKPGETRNLEVVKFSAESIDLEEAIITASRAMVEVKADRTVFNVQGTINSTGDDVISLLRKAPGVTVDNNDNINVLGRSGVQIFIDGKQMPLSGEDLKSYLQNLTAEQIDRIDIITNPGAKYDAEGNAGIIDIRLKKDKNLGANGSFNTNYTRATFSRFNIGGSGNYRNKSFNLFGNVNAGNGTQFNDITFLSYMNDLELDEINQSERFWKYYNYQIGTDFFLNKNSTLGFIVVGNQARGGNNSFNRISIAQENTATEIDSILVAHDSTETHRLMNTFNINYRFEPNKAQSLNIDLDYGRFRNEADRFQPNNYYNSDESVLMSRVVNTFKTPSDIDIYTFKLDYERNLLGGKAGIGTKISKVVSDNTFIFNDYINETDVRNDTFSNDFLYDETVYAAYVSYNRPISQKLNLSLGLRAELTDAIGELDAYLPSLQEDPVVFDYWKWFPNLGLSYQLNPQNTLALNAGRRINRPDYGVLNPFNNRLSELSYEKGNPYLSPEIVQNLELGYTYAYRYNLKVGYSKTFDQITRLIGPDENDPRAGFITWDNLAEQTIISANLSAPVQFGKKWNAYFNLSASHIDNQADYGDGAIVDVQAFSYNIFQQHTINLPWKLTGEISGWYNGPGIWGGVFEYDPSWSLNLGLQRKFLQNQLSVRVSFNDIFYEAGWEGDSRFNGLYTIGKGDWDSRRFSVNLNYNFGNQNVKTRKRKTGLQDEADRVGGE